MVDLPRFKELEMEHLMIFSFPCNRHKHLSPIFTTTEDNCMSELQQVLEELRQ